MSNKIIQSKKLWFLSFLTFLLLSINSSQAATSLGSRLSGYILLQVESLGEAWYIIPKEQKRVYLQNGSVAYQAMRELSLGITNSNLAKIPVGIEPRFNDVDTDSDGLSDNLEKGLDTDPNKADTDNDGFSDGNEIKNNYSPLGPNKLSYDNTLVNRLKGYILLQVEKQGQAWYLNPKDGKRYYMQDGEAAYNIMRFLSLGITNNNLKLIPISDRKFTSTNNGNSSSANQGNNNNNNSTSTPPTTPPGNGNGGGGGGGGGGSNPPSADTQVPTTPTNLLSSISGTQVSLSWTASSDNVGVSGYQILRSTTNGSGYAQIATSNTNSYTNTGLSIGTTYYYVVKAYDAAGNISANSSQAQATPADTVAPTVPSNLVASASGSQISLSWTAATDNVGVVQYLIERSATSAISGFTEIATSTTSVYVNTRLAVNSTFYYRVRAQDAAGNISVYSSVASATTDNSIVVPDTQAPTVPSSLSAAASGTQVSLSWTASSDNVGVSGYQILRSTTNGSGYAQIATSNTNSYTNTGLSIGTTYYYVVKAYDAAGNISANSSQAQATVPVPVDTQAPTAPTTLTAVAASREVALSWGAASDNTAVTGYQILRSTTNGSGYGLVSTSNTTVYVDINLTNGTTYYYVVKAYDAANNISANSNQAQATPVDSVAPSVPSNLTATVSGTQVSLSWVASTDNVAVSQYLIERSSSNTSSFTQIATSNTTSYTNIGLTNNNIYYYRVRAQDSSSNYSGYSNTASATVGTVVTSNPSITAVSGSISYGQTATITGTNFGSKSQVSPLVYDTMESGSFSPNWGSTNQLIVGSNSANKRHSNSNYYGTQNFQGNLRTYPNVPPDGSGYGANGYFTGSNSQLSDTWYGRYWFKLDNNFDFGTTGEPQGDGNLANIKIFRLWNPGNVDENFVAATQGYNGGNIIYTTEQTLETTHYMPSNTSAWTKNVWHVFDFEFKEGSLNASNGIFRMWFDGKLIEENRAVMTRQDFDLLKRPLILGFYNSWSDGNTDRDDFYIDDAYIDGTWARVMLCDQSTWNDSVNRHCEIQSPQNTWSNTSIQIAVNTGSFTAGQTAYMYVVDSNGNVNASGYPVVISGIATVDTQAPTTPSSLNASVSGTTISLSWTASTDNVGVSQYLIERSTSASSGFSQIATSNTTSYSNSGLANSTTYYYRIRAQDAAGNNSGYSSTANATTGVAPASSGNLIQNSWDFSSSSWDADAIGTNPWSPITNFTFTSGQSDPFGTNKAFRIAIPGARGWQQRDSMPDLNLNYDAVTASVYVKYGSAANFIFGITQTDVSYTVGEFEQTFNFDANGVPTWSSSNTHPQDGHTVTNVGNGWYRLSVTYNLASRGIKNHPFSARVTPAGQYSGGAYAYITGFQLESGTVATAYVEKPSGSGDTQAPSAPANLSVSVSGTQATLSWSAASDNTAVTGYQILRSTTNGGAYTQVNTANTTSYTHTGLTAGTYYYVVKAYDAAGNYSANSNQVIVTIASQADTQAPTAPSNLTATASGNQISLNWTASTDNVGVSQYLIESSIGGGSYSQVATSNYTSYTMMSLADNTAYSCRVRAQDAAGNMSLYSSVANATTGTGSSSGSVSISGVNDNTISNNQSITISGSGFGTKIAVGGIVGPPVLWDNFEDGTNGQLVQATAAKWDRVRSDNLSGPRYYSGAIDGSMGVRTGSGIYNGVTAGTTRTLIEDDEFRSLYLDYYIKAYKGAGLLQRSNKQVMIWSANVGVSEDGPNTAFWQITQGSGEPPFAFSEYSCANDPFSIVYGNGWGIDEFTTARHVQIEYRRPSVAGVNNGYLRMWYDGVLVSEDSSFGSYSCNPDTNYLDNLYIGHYQDIDSAIEPIYKWISCPGDSRCDQCPAGASGCSVNNENWLPARQDEFFYDNIYIDKSIARVEIGNASTYGASTRREIQVPMSWNNGSIQFTVNKGGLSSGQTAYIYVLDSNGNVNANGYPVTIN